MLPRKWTFILSLSLVLACTYGARAQSTDLSRLSFKDTDLQRVDARSVPSSRPLLLIYFRSDCDHCIQMSQAFKAHKKDYADLHIWMVSAEAQEEIRLFEDMNGLYDWDNVQVLEDYGKKMHYWFSFNELPFIVLFDAKGKQVAVFKDLPSRSEIRTALGQGKAPGASHR